jgi:hypothetical protein
MQVHEFKDLSRLTRDATISLWVYMVLQLLTAAGTVYIYSVGIGAASEEGATAFLIVAVGQLVAMLVSFVLVGCWIYRASANAHSFSDDMSISPGWAVGWYFIPIANLFKPFQAMKETWMASHYRGDWRSEPAPSLMTCWWGLWIVTGILSQVSFQMSIRGDADQAGGLVTFIDVITAVLNVPLCLVLIAMMKRIAGVQIEARQAEAFT